MTIAADMKILAIAPWFGGKRTLAPTIIEELGTHRAYWEPFCGGMSVLLSKPASSFETVNDLHADLVNLARCMQHPALGPSLYRRLRRALNSQELFIESRQRCNSYPATIADLDVDRAYDYFLTSWQGMNGMAGTKRYNLGFARRLTKNGGHAARRFSSAVETIPAFRRRLRNVTVLSTDGIELCERIEDASGVVIYADPPYLTKGADYEHDFQDGFMGQANDHERLARALCRFSRTRVVLSYYDHPALRALYPRWTIRKVYMTKAMVSQGRRGGGNDTVAPEVLLINGRAYSKEN